MAKQLPIVNTNSDTFFSWISKTNLIINLANTEIVTANSSANGAITTGVGFVIGKLGANTVVATTIAGGNTLSTTPLSFSTNTVFEANTNKIVGALDLGANSSSRSEGIKITGNTTGTQVIDSFPHATFKTAKYIVSIKNNNNTDRQATEIMILTDGTTVFSTEYATLTSNSQICVFTANVNGANVELSSNSISNSVTYNISRTLLIT